MNKILLAAAVSAALFTVEANAAVVVPPATSIPTLPGTTTAANLEVDFTATTGIAKLTNVPATNVLYVTGSSAATKFLGSAITAISAPNTVVYKYSNNAADILTYVFVAGPAGAAAGLVNGQVYIVHKRDRDGSLTAAVSASAAAGNALLAAVQYNTLAGLAAATIDCPAQPTLSSTSGVAITCSATAAANDPITAAAPAKSNILGIADVDAAQFASPLNGGTTVNKLTTAALKMGSTPVAVQDFGVAVTTKLRDALQAAELASGLLPSTCSIGNETEACMPSFTTEQISSMFANGRFNDWTKLSYGQGLNLVTAATAASLPIPGNTAVHICSRAAGSGTLATLNTVFENAPCTATNEAIQAAVDGVNTTGTEGAAGTAKAYHSTKGSGDLENCLETMDGYDVTVPGAVSSMVANKSFPLPTLSGTANFRWAVGILNADRNTSNALPYRFVKIDGFSPSMENTANGKYRFWSELSYITALPTTVLSPVATALVKAMSDPAIIVKSKATNPAGFVTGYLATAGKALTSATAYDPTLPVMPWTHSNGTNTAGSLNHCRAANILSGAYPLQGLK